MELLPSQGRILKAVMDVAYYRHTVLASNLANVNTPGFRRQDVDYSESLRASLSGHQEPADSLKVVDSPAVQKADGNTVDADLELARITQNALVYQLAAEIMSRKLAMMRRALSGGA